MASFKEAFSAARTRGAKTFTWQGKKYTTEVKGSPTDTVALTLPKKIQGKLLDDNKVVKAANKAINAATPTPKAKVPSTRPKARPSGMGTQNPNSKTYGKRTQDPQSALASMVKNKRTGTKTPFKEAFATARKAGKKTFMWEGKKYTTKVK